jgi:hypothetical protein
MRGGDGGHLTPVAPARRAVSDESRAAADQLRSSAMDGDASIRKQRRAGDEAG